MNLALVTSRFAPELGGLETHVRELAAGLARRGFVVDVLTQTADRSLPACEHQDGYVVRRFPVVVASENYAFAPGLPLFLARDRPRYDLIHAHNYHALAALAAAVAAGGRPVVSPPTTTVSVTRRCAAPSIARIAWRVVGCFRKAPA